MAKVRIYEIAKELNVSNKEMTEQLIKAGFPIKNHMSTLEDSQVEWVKKQFAHSSQKGSASQGESTSSPQNQANEVATKSVEKASSENATKALEKRPAAPAKHTDKKRENPSEASNPTRPQRSSTPGKIMPVGGWTEENRAAWEARRSAKNQDNGARSQQDNNARTSRTGKPNDKRRDNNNNRPENRNFQGNRPNNNHSAGTYNKPAKNQPGGVKNEYRNNGNGTPTESKNAPRNTYPKMDTPAEGKMAGRNNRSANRNAGGDKEKGRNAGGNRSNDNRFNANNQQPYHDYSRPVKKPKHKKKKEDTVAVRPDTISIPENIQVREFAEALHVQGAELVKKLFEMGTMVTVNQMIDFDTAEILASLYDVKVLHEVSREEEILKEIVDDEASLQPRPPIVTVMGHVDHGKTSLLDKIRSSNVVSGEAGGITQHIGAYQAKVHDNLITFIDTPGHEAFTAMRARGANLTDIVILVVAADDGVMPQTIEAINHIKAANVPFLVALNKIDKPDIDPDRVKQELTKYEIVPEEWGGDTIFVPVSAKTGQGLDNLMEMLLLLAEMNELKANPNRAAEGVVIEGRLDKGKGPVATVLVQKGTLNVGDYLICGVNWCKVRSMTSDNGKRITTAPPSTPVEITGWTDVPEAGEKVQAVDEKVAKEVSTLRTNEKKIEEQKKVSRVTLDDFFKQMQDHGRQELNLIIKGDVQGSIEALADSLIKLSTDEVKVSVIHSAVGAINETDVMLASASDAIIIGFNVRPDVKARQFAEKENIDVRLYRVIYEAIKDVKEAMAGLLEPEHREKYLGQAEVRQVIKVPDVGNIAGAYVLEGKIQRNAQIRILRAGVIIYEGVLSSLRRFKDDAKEVMEGYECGIGIKDYNDLKEGDIIEVYVIEDIPREL